MPATDDAGREHNQPAVDEREHRRHQPDRSGCGERKPTACKQRQHDESDSGSSEPSPRGRLFRRVAPEGDLERDLDRGEHDQRVESVPARE